MQKLTTSPSARSLLLNQSLTPSARLIWICLHEHHARSQTPAELEAGSGLSRGTILSGLERLRTSGWVLPTEPTTHPAHIPTAHPASPPVPSVQIPPDLLPSPRLNPSAKLLYGILQLTTSPGKTSHAEIASISQFSLNTVKKGAADLCQEGWLDLAQRSQRAPLTFTLLNPALQRREAALKAAVRRLTRARFDGEAIMREYLNILVDSDEFQDSVRPGFLINPYTGERMEFDRFYPPHVALEYQGPQHDGPTKRYPSVEKARRQMGQDLTEHQQTLDYLKSIARSYRYKARRPNPPDPLPKSISQPIPSY